MKTTIFVFALMLAGMSSIHAQQYNYDAEWKRIDSLMKMHQPRSVMQLVDSLFTAASSEGNIPHMVRAFMYQINYHTNLKDDPWIANITRIEAVIATAKCPYKNILHSVAADYYWNYYWINRFIIDKRIASEVLDNDLRTWDYRKIVARCEEHCRAALDNADTLKVLPIERFNDMLLRVDTAVHLYRPTLWDFLAFRTVDFYTNSLKDIAHPVESFDVDASAFAPAEVFIYKEIRSEIDSASFKIHALNMLRSIIAFHIHRADTAALIDADLHRLDLVYEYCRLQERDSLYLNALHQLAEKYSAHSSCSEALYRVAKCWVQQGNNYDHYKNPAAQWKNRQALELIDKVIQTYPDCYGVKNCRALQKTIRMPHLTVAVDNAVLPDKPILVNVSYKNISQIYARIIPVNFVEAMNYNNNYMDRKEEYLDWYSKLYNKQKSSQEIKIRLPDDGDYQLHVTEIALPRLKTGYYLIITSNDSLFNINSTVLSENRLWVSSLSYFTNTENKYFKTRLHVLNRETGLPISGVVIKPYKRIFDRKKNTQRIEFIDKEFHTNQLGQAVISNEDITGSEPILFLLQQGQDQYSDFSSHFFADIQSKDEEPRTSLFLDRGIYRPGQTVYFKGLVMKFSAEGTPSVVDKHRQTLFLKNSANETLAELEVVSNKFGSFTGSFLMPANILTGQVMILSDKNLSTRFFRVEDYKRPKFEAVFDTLNSAPRLGDNVTLVGRARAYAGNAVDGAKVEWRVMRETLYPLWRWWWGEPNKFGPSQVANGSATADAEGRFMLTFKAIPNERTDKNTFPVFRYRVIAQVSDINGETHSAETTVAVGYQSLILSTDAGKTVNRDSLRHISVSATNLNGGKLEINGKPQILRGTVSISRLNEPGILISRNKNRSGGQYLYPTATPKRPDRFSMSRDEFKRLFPLNVYDNEDDMETWTVDKTVLHKDFSCSVDSLKFVLADAAKWAQGMYRINLSVNDNYGEQIKYSHFFRLISFDSPQKPLSGGLVFEPLNSVAQPDDEIKVLIGSVYDKAQVLFQLIDKHDDIIEERIISLSSGAKILNIPVKEKYYGNIFMSASLIRHNSFNDGNFLVDIPYYNKKLKLELSSFRDRLVPGQAEEWSIKVKDWKGGTADAELLASMYDASLDAFVTHKWWLSPWRTTLNYPKIQVASFDTRSSLQITSNHNFETLAERVYNRLYSGTNFDNYILNDIEFVTVGSSRSMSNYMIRGTGVNKAVHKNEYGHMDFSEESEASTDSSNGLMAASQKMAEQTPENIYIRSNFNETAFFYPSLRANEKGETVVSFTLPDALTRWNFQALAWTSDLKLGYIKRDIVAQRDLMIVTNVPRFLREGDTVVFNVKYTNNSEKTLDVSTQLEFFDALSMKPLNIYIDSEQKSISLLNDDADNKAIKNRNSNNNTSNMYQNSLALYSDAQSDEQKTLETEKGNHDGEPRVSEMSSGVSRNSTENIQNTEMRPSETGEENKTCLPNIHESVSEKQNTVSGYSRSDAETSGYGKINSQKPAENSRNDIVALSEQSNKNKTQSKDDYGDVQNDFSTVYDNSDLSAGQSSLTDLKLAASKSQTKEWKLYIPEGLSAIKYRIKAWSGNSSDGEEGVIPVLTDRILLTETMPFSINSNKPVSFDFKKLGSSLSASKTLRNHSYTVEFTANPAWTAIQSLPYIMEYPYECAEQTFNRYYANALASHIAGSNTKIKQVFDLWRTAQPDALKSNLEKNPELKSILIEETPWVREARTDTEQKQRIGTLFDINRMSNELAGTKRKLQEIQNPSGAFPWFRDDRNDRYITQVIVAGFGHLAKLTGDNNFVDMSIVNKAVKYLDEAIIEDYNKMKELEEKDKTNTYKHVYLSAVTAHYLYARSFFPNIGEGEAKEAIDYYISKLEKFWTQYSIYTKGMIALALHRRGNTAAKHIMRSLSENAINSEQDGMYWQLERGWQWYQSPTETQSLMIEAYSEILDDKKSVEELKLWLLKHKHTHNWKTTKATANAIYALLFQGENLLDDNSTSTVLVCGESLTSPSSSAASVEAGTGYFKKTWSASEINGECAQITVTPPSDSHKLTWGAAYWQYFEDLDKVESADGGIKITKKLYIKTITAEGEKLEPITAARPIRLGDRVTVRMEITAANEMEYVHLKDMRASAFEPVNTLSGYKWQKTFGYYESTRDASTNFFISRLPKGTHIFEYDMYATQRGEFSNGIPTIQCMYAPEYSGHDKGIRIKVE